MTSVEAGPSLIGARARAVDWEQKTSGTARYAADELPPGTIFARILRSPHPHATIVSIDLSRAREAAGVRAIVTAADFPNGIRYVHSGPPYVDRPPMADGVVRFLGQEVVAIAADTTADADAALALVRVRYRRRRAPLTVAAALRRGAVQLHARHTGAGNVASHDLGSFGDVAAGRAASTTVVEGSFRYPRISHACMETNTTLAWWRDDRQLLELYTSTQAPWFTQHEVAHVLGLKPEQVTCRDVAVGGGFGLKSKVCDQEAIASALSRAAGQPVLLALSREEEFATTRPRHAFDTRLRLHADDGGRLCLVEAEIDVDNGAYNHFGPSVMKVGIKTLGSMYRPDGVSYDARLVDTALQPGGPFRGYGSPQTTLPLECLVDELAERLGEDPLEFRRRNARPPGETTLAGQRVGSSRLVECIDAARAAIGWDDKRRARLPDRGVGIAVSMHGSGSYAFEGSNRADAAIEVDDRGGVLVRFGGADPGTGQRTILAQIAAHELGVPLEDVSVLMGDSEHTPFDMGAWSSRGTHMGGHATAQAARELASELLALAREKLGSEAVRLEGGRVVSDNGSVPLGDLVRQSPNAVDGRLAHESSYVDPRMERFGAGNQTPNHAASYTFAAHAVEVEVDRGTGAVRILDYVAVHDIGRAINPIQVEGQIIGGVAQGLGATLGEELLYEGGRLVNPAYLNYALPRAADLPDIRVLLIEGAEPAGPYDAKSVGELPIIPPAPAVANAIYDAVGVRLRDLPFTPDKVLTALSAGSRRRRYRLHRRPDRWQVEAIRRLYPLGVHHLLDRIGTRFARRTEPRELAALRTPSTVEELVAGLDGETAVIGGGTDLLLQRRQGLAAPVRLLAVRDVSEMRQTRETAGGDLEIGGAVALAAVADDPRTPAVLRDAIESIASTQIRATATVAGNLLQAKRCWFFRNGFECYKRGGWTCPCYAVQGDHRFYHAAMGAHRCQATTPSDIATALTALDASLTVAGPAGRREVHIEELYTGPGETALEHDDVVTRVRIPARSRRWRGAFQKLRLWEGDFAVVAAAVTVGDGDARVVLGALAPTPWRSDATERALRAATGVPAAKAALDGELSRTAHPLPGNDWKLTAAVGVVGAALDALAVP